MYGLVKLAAAQEINLNNIYTNREDRLKDDYDENIRELRDLESQRDPEVERAANKQIYKGMLGGTGIGAALGAGVGAIAGRKSGALPAAGAGGLLGAATGFIPGTIYGAVKADDYIQENEDPDLLRKIQDSSRKIDRNEEELSRHYLLEDRIRNSELERMRIRDEMYSR